MADEEIKGIKLDGSTATWSINKHGAINGTYIGTFRFRCFLTPIQKIDADREYREVLGVNPTMADENVSLLSYALTQLKYRVLESPPFWRTGAHLEGDLPDEEIITEVLNAAIGAEVKYRNQLKKKKETALSKAKKAAEKLATAEVEDEGQGEENSD
jgi:hypothetical protein